MAIVTDGLVLYLHGACGKNNPATRKWVDLSGNGNHGELVNFGYTEDSGWADGGLKFDGVDDYVQLPELGLNPDDFTYQLDDRIVSFRGDSNVIIKDGEIQVTGRNLTRNSTGLTEWKTSYGANILNNDNALNHPMAKFARVNTSDWGAEIKGAPTSLGDVWSFSFIARNGTSDGNIQAALMGRTIDDRHRGNWYPTIEKICDLQNGWALYKCENSIIDREGVVRVNIRFFNAGQTNDGYHDYALPKLEKGDKATPWTPAPEDIIENTKIDHTTPFVEENTIHTYRLYNRALSDDEILQNYQAGHEWIPQIGQRTVTTTMKPITADLTRKGKGKREVISIAKPITSKLERKGKGKREVITTMKPITSILSRKGIGKREVTTTMKLITGSISKKLPPIHANISTKERNPHIATKERTPNITTKERIPRLEVD